MWMEPFDQAASVLYVLGALIAGGFAVLIVLRLRDGQSDEALKRNLEKYHDYFNYVSANADGADALLPPSGSLTTDELKAIQSKLLEWIESIGGEHRSKLTALCRDLGLVKLELERLRSPWHAVRIDAAYHLGVMRAEGAAAELIGMLEKEGPDPTAFVVGRAAAKCAATMDELRRIVSLLTLHHPEARQLIADIVASASLDPLPLYAELLTAESDETSLTVALTGLSSRNEPGMNRLAAPLLGSEWKEVRIKAAKLLLRYPQLLPPKQMSELLHNPEWEIRAAAVKAAGDGRLVLYMNELQLALSDEEWWVRHHGAQSLALLGPEGFIALCETACGSENDSSREAALHAVHEELDRAAAVASQELKQLPYYSRLNEIYRNLFAGNPGDTRLNGARISS
ncbi:HEAT repeat domain-containing protein [Paenibacillus allorhizosphaerae]|uniref:HEAT repeat domain-containing protein n=1 Tax=Paenibacillus allorhizosphaerae TaxID=2849866 RepID=A0ABM8VMA2_9BACL|nr:HEAT repeat domain-containing protein [Paenibacillus allorhizosphaerae]CAG7649516.1 hypothetical protein PAECIP111802_04509 [Paenibacillus allorhizosphaerae]